MACFSLRFNTYKSIVAAQILNTHTNAAGEFNTHVKNEMGKPRKEPIHEKISIYTVVLLWENAAQVANVLYAQGAIKVKIVGY